VHRPDNEVILLHVPEAVGAEADKNSQYTVLCPCHVVNFFAFVEILTIIN